MLFEETLKSRQKVFARKNIKNNLHLLILLFGKYELNKNQFKNQSDINLSFWFYHEAIFLAILKKKNVINNYYSRAHGFDLFEFNGKDNYLPFRKFQLKHVTKVFCVSRIGENYLKAIYPEFRQKISYSYLGTKNHNYFNEGNCPITTIVSCSGIVTVKRLHLILEALMSVTQPVIWVHFGDGHLFNDIYNKIKQLPIHVNVVFKGQCANDEILHYYKTMPVSYLVNTSISEGLPVSMMEAISFGIPIIATNVGGVSEIVNEDTGYLLSKDFDSKELSYLIDSYKKSKFSTSQTRKSIKLFFESNFSAEKNYTNLYRQLITNN